MYNWRMLKLNANNIQLQQISIDNAASNYFYLETIEFLFDE